MEPVASLRQILDHLNRILRSSKWYEVCRMPVYELGLSKIPGLEQFLGGS